MRGHRSAVAALVLAAATLTACASAARGRQSLLLRPESPVFSARAPEHYLVRLDTSEGTVVVEVQRDWAPHGADRFYALVHHGFYDGQRFFRVLAGFIAQFGLNGDPAVIAAWKHRTMPDDPVRLSNVRGTLAYAMTGPNTRTTQIFINLADNRRLDAQGFAPFGKVVRGMDVADRLYARYDESAGGGVRGGKQGAIEAGGNEYLERNFPRLDYIKRAVIVAH